MQATPSPVPPRSPHPASQYSRYSTNQPLVAGEVHSNSPYPTSSYTPRPAQVVTPRPFVPPELPRPVQAPAGARPQPIGIPPPSATSSYYPPAPPSSIFVSRKRLIVACDGTILP
jgi:hypothetical protein